MRSVLPAGSELQRFANAISHLNPSYSLGGSSGGCASAAGSFSSQTTRHNLMIDFRVPAPNLTASGCP
jgi:hypothetical protein